jgi:hypothetical protein
VFAVRELSQIRSEGFNTTFTVSFAGSPYKIGLTYSATCKDSLNETIPDGKNTYFCFCVTLQPNYGLGCPYVEVIRSHTHTHTHTYTHTHTHTTLNKGSTRRRGSYLHETNYRDEYQ